MLSIIIPAYNVPENLIRECIESISPQMPHEIIVVDDGSDIPVENLLRDIKESKNGQITFFRQENKGLSEARNAGISIAKGEYIQFVDADDTLIAEPYAECINLLKNESPDLLNFQLTTSNPTNITISQPRNIQRLSGEEYLRTQNLKASACGYIFKKDLLDRMPANENLTTGLRFAPGIQNEDERFTPLLYLNAETVVATDIPAYYYRQREGSLQHSYSEEFLDKRFSDFLATIVYLNSLNLPALERRIRQLTMDYIYNIIRVRGDWKTLERGINDLKREHLFPLPHIRYTTKYWLFSYIANSKIGRWLMMNVSLTPNPSAPQPPKGGLGGLGTLSILIPTYNDECLELVRSLHKQCATAAADVEIIVADDCSTDSRVKEINTEIADIEGCRIVWCSPNKGRAGIRNYLAEIAKGEWLLFIDGDMEIRDPLFVDKYINEIAAHAPSTDFVIYGGYAINGDANMLKGNLRYIYERKNEHKHTVGKRREKPYRDFHTSNFLAHRSTLNLVPFNEAMKLYGFEDVLFGKQLKEEGIKIYHTDNPVSFEKFESNADFLRKTDESIRTQQEFADLIGDYSTLLKAQKRIEKWHLAFILKAFSSLFRNKIKRNLLGAKPSLLLFNIYKLSQVIDY